MSTKQRLAADDLYRFERLLECSLSPDGRRVIYTRQTIDRESEKRFSNLWLVDTDGQTPPRPFTQGQQSDSRPVWSPDGTQLAFVSNRADEKQPQIHLIATGGGEARQLTRLNGQIDHLQWSVDGQFLLCTVRARDEDVLAREQDERAKKLGVVARHITRADFKNDGQGFLPQNYWQLWRIDIASGEGTQLTTAAYDVRQPALSPDGTQMVFAANRHEDAGLAWDQIDLLVMPAAGGEVQALDLPPGPKSHPVFSPDGAWVAYFTQGTHNERWRPQELWLAPVDGHTAAISLTATYDRHLGNATLGDSLVGVTAAPVWANDGKRIYFQFTHHGRTGLASVTRAGTDWQEIINTEVMVNDFCFDAGQMQLATVQATELDPVQLWVQSWPQGEARQLSDFNAFLREEIDLTAPEMTWIKGPDGNDLQGWILKPPGFQADQRYPAVLEIHGGPMNQYGFVFMHEFHFLAAQGFVVYYTNPRGGQGYGADHCRAIYNDWGNRDYADVMAWNDYVMQQPFIDVERLCVTGGSYGGYMTNWIIARSQTFKAAVTQRCVSNLVSMMGSSDLGIRFQALFGGNTLPWDDLDHYWKLSPISQIGNAKTPTLVIHSESDLRCDIEQGEQVFMALKYLGVPTEMVRFPEESHGLSRGGRTDRRIVRLQHILRWFRLYALGEAA